MRHLLFFQRELYSNCLDVNPESSATGAVYGYSHATGGYDGGQAEYVRVPMAGVGPTVIPADMDLDDAVLLADCYPTGYQAAEMGDIEEDQTVVVFGAGLVGIFAAKRMNQASVKRHLLQLIEHIQAGRIKPSEIITHRIPLEEVSDAHHIFSSKLDNCIKTVLVPPRAMSSN